MKEDLIKMLIENAMLAQQNSYSPYSKYKVGACLLCKSGNIYKGTNVENASYGLTCCAERNAMFSAISNGDREFEAIAIVGGDLSDFGSPCGACRQVFCEFNPNMLIILAKKSNDKMIYETYKPTDLLPKNFSL